MKNSNIIEIGIIGDKATGKTSLINNFFNNSFYDGISSTVGFDNYIKELKSSNNIKYKLKINDTAGQEQYHSLAINIFKKCKGLILVYAINNKVSFENVKNIWINNLNNSIDLSKIPIILVGNKNDLKDRIILEEEGQKIAKKNNFHFFETSAKTGDNVNNIFQKIFEIIVNDIEKDIKKKKEDKKFIIKHEKDKIKKDIEVKKVKNSFCMIF